MSPQSSKIENEILKNDYKFLETNTLNTVRLFGQNKPSAVVINGNNNGEWRYNANTKVIISNYDFEIRNFKILINLFKELKLLNLKVKINDKFSIQIQ